MRTIKYVSWIAVAATGLALAQTPASTTQQSQSDGRLLFLFTATYADSAWAAMAEKPQNRRELLQAAVAKLGGNVEHFWYSFGDSDCYVVISFPDNVTAETLQIVGLAGGGFKSVRAIPLLTVEQEMAAAAKAGELRKSAAYKAAHDALQH
jgi:uncharacterized protein with GYD domain